MSFLDKSALKQFPQLLISQVQPWQEREYNSKKKKKKKKKKKEEAASGSRSRSNFPPIQ